MLTASTWPAKACAAPAQSKIRRLDQRHRRCQENPSARELRHPGIIPLRWAASFRNPGRHYPVTPGRLRRNPQPRPQWFARVLENRAGRQRRLPPAGAATQTSSRHDPWIAGHSAFRTDQPARPQQPDIFTARGIVAEPSVHLVKGPGVIRPRPGTTRIVHPAIVAKTVKGVKDIRPRRSAA